MPFLHVNIEPITVISVPDRAVPFILLQRTDYLLLPKWKRLHRALCLLTGRSPINAAVAIESKLRRAGVIRDFNSDMAREYEDLRPHLPPRASAVLDVGCGVAGLAVHIYRHYGGDGSLRLYLMDRTETVSSISYGLASTTGEFYNSLEVTRNLLVSNEIPDQCIVTLEARDDRRIVVAEPLDLVVSTISWGFHYPVATYLEQAHERLAPGGRLIIDVRKGSGGVAEVGAKFGNVAVISEGAKHERILAMKA